MIATQCELAESMAARTVGLLGRKGLAPGEDPSAMLLQRITWTTEASGVRQHWQSSADDGASWTTVFDGHYRPRA